MDGDTQRPTSSTDIQSELRIAQRLGHIGSWQWDAAADKLSGSEEFFRIYGLDPATEFPKFNDQDGVLYPHESWQKLNDAMHEALATGAGYQLDVQALRNGEPIWITTRSEVVRDASGKASGLIGTVQDITERKRTEEAMSQQRRLYEAILTTTPDLAYVFDTKHRFIYANDVLLKMWGKTWDEAIGKTCLELGYEPWHAEMHDREIDQVIATKQPVRGEVPFSGTFGRRIYDYIFTPVLGDDGQVVAVAGTTRDVTEYRQTQESLRETDRRKDEFLATLAHELRNPLAPIRNSINILQMSAPGNASSARVCEMMERQVNHMVRLIDDLMEISRITRGAIAMQREDTTLEMIVRSAVDSSAPAIEASGHELTVSIPGEAVPLNGDAVRLAQVISNLLNNAAKYTDRGGTISLTAYRKGCDVFVSVRDTGIGIAEDQKATIFEMFAQVDRTAHRAQGGLGIGLTLAKRIVEMHDGSITVHSDGLGQGSEFVVRLPVAEKPLPAAQPEPSVAPLQTSRRVLVVDDNRDAAASLAMLVRMLGSDVQTAYDGASALSMIESYRPEIVLLDIGMPGMDGFEVAQHIRERAEFDDIVLVALTGWGQERDRERTADAGFDDHLVKPAEIGELQELLADPHRSFSNR